MITIEELTKLAGDWQLASHHDAFGMGAGSGTMAKAHDNAKERFLYGLRTARAAEIADALVELHNEKRVRVDDAKHVRLTMKESIVAAIQDLRTGDNTVMVQMRWSKEFYDEIQKAGEPA